MQSIHVLLKPASGNCNLKCKYCFYANEMQNRHHASFGMMDETTLRNVIRKTLLAAEQECTIAFQGGEPTLAGLEFFRKCLALEKEYNTRHIPISHMIQTNGSTLDEEWCRFFAENNFLVGLSVDGIRATHDIYRKDSQGHDTYFKTLYAAELLQKASVPFNILTVVHARTALRIRKIYDNYKKLGFLWQQYIACLDPLETVQGGEEYSLQPAAYGYFLIDLFDLWYEDIRNGNFISIRQFENYVAILMGLEPEACDMHGVCSIQNVVEADGSVYPCDFYALDAYKLGNLNEDSFDEIYRKRTEKGFIEQSVHKTDKCRKCRWFSLCRGGCRRHRELPGLSYGENRFCDSYQLFFEARYEKMHRLAQQLKHIGTVSNR